MRRWLFRVGATGHQPMPPIDVLIRRPHEQHDLYIAVLITCVCVIWSGRGCTRRAQYGTKKLTIWTHVSSWYAVLAAPRPVVCRSRMLIAFQRVWAVRRFDVGCTLFVVPQQPRAGTVTNRRCFLSQSGAHQYATCQKWLLPKLSRDGGVYPRASIPKRGTWSHPAFDHSRSPAMHSRKKKEKSLDGWEEPREHDKRCRF